MACRHARSRQHGLKLCQAAVKKMSIATAPADSAESCAWLTNMDICQISFWILVFQIPGQLQVRPQICSGLRVKG